MKFFRSLVRHAVLGPMVLNPYLTTFDVYFP
jgi:hypothetical protein